MDCLTAHIRLKTHVHIFPDYFNRDRENIVGIYLQANGNF